MKFTPEEYSIAMERALGFVKDQILEADAGGLLGFTVTVYHDEIAPNVAAVLRRQGYTVETIKYFKEDDIVKYGFMITF